MLGRRFLFLLLLGESTSPASCWGTELLSDGISGLGLKISQIFPKSLRKTLLDFQWLLLAGLPIDQMLLLAPSMTQVWG